MNDTDMEKLEEWQTSRIVDVALLASFNVACDTNLRCLEREVDLLTEQVNKPHGVQHLRRNWPRFKGAFNKLQDIYIDMINSQKHERT